MFDCFWWKVCCVRLIFIRVEDGNLVVWVGGSINVVVLGYVLVDFKLLIVVYYYWWWICVYCVLVGVCYLVYSVVWFWSGVCCCLFWVWIWWWCGFCYYCWWWGIDGMILCIFFSGCWGCVVSLVLLMLVGCY